LELGFRGGVFAEVKFKWVIALFEVVVKRARDEDMVF